MQPRRFVGMVALFGLAVMATAPVRAQWVNNGYTWDRGASTDHIEGGGGNGTGTSSTSSQTTNSGPPFRSWWNYQTTVLKQKFTWTGTGPVPLSFIRYGHGTLDGHVIRVLNGQGQATSSVSVPGASSWTYPDTQKKPNGNIAIGNSGALFTVDYIWSLSTSAKGFYSSGGPFPQPASYDVLATSEYTID